MPTTIPTSRPGLRLSLYPDHEALHLADELTHLELVGARVPRGDGGPGPSSARLWLESCVTEPGFRLVTLSMDGLLVGFLTGTVHGGTITLRQLVLASSVRTRHPDLVGVLADAFVDSAELPWGQVRLDRGCPALGHLLQEGWHPTVPPADETTQEAVDGKAEPRGTLVLTSETGR